MIEVRNLVYEIVEGEKKRKILDIDHLLLEDCKINIISGVSGSGKSTFLYALLGLLEITKGDVFINQTSLYGMSKIERDNYRLKHYGIVYQRHNLFPFMNVLDNVIVPFYLREEKVTKQIKDRAMFLLDRVGLADKVDKNISALSGGEQQRVAIARGLITEPEILICDEPTASLDKGNTKKFMDDLLELKKGSKTMIVISTHDAIVKEYADEIVEISDGRVVKELL